MMRKIFVISLLSFAATASCSKKVPNQLAVNSSFQFIQDKSLQGTEYVAKLNEDLITHSQLLSPSPALMELEQRINDAIARKVYSLAASGNEIVFAFEEPKDGFKKFIGKDFKDGVTVAFDPKMTGGVAKLDGKMIAADELSKNDTLLARLMIDRFDQSIRALEGLFARRKVLEASKAANMTMEQFIKDKILGGNVGVTENDVDEFAKKNNLTEKDMTEEMRAQVKDTIMSHRREAKITEYVSKNLISGPIHVAFGKPAMTVSVPNLESAPQVGEGPISVLFFSRLDCDNCKSIGTSISDFVESHHKYFKMNYVFNFPTNSNEERMVAEASMCVKKQNSDMFWKFMGVFDPKSNENLEEAINQAVKTSGADFEGFRTCFLAREFKDQVEAQLQTSSNLGFYRNPVVVLDGKVMEVPQSQDVIDNALALKAEKGLGFNLFYRIKQFFKNL